MNRAVFLDRDGVINRKAPEGQYVTRWSEMRFLPHVAEAIALFKRSGFLVIVTTNQRCVAKGLITEAGLAELHEKMQRQFRGTGAVIDAVYHCPHDSAPACDCRKPAPGMLLTAAREHEIDLGASWMIGDSVRDVEAGKNAGCKTALLATGTQDKQGADLLASSLFESARQIVRMARPAAAPDPEGPASMTQFA
jgi:D-glycero-D-manno-heptose 1,7-bisphosphate phosphatase